MTNEQAIIELQDLISDDNTDRENEALLLAIEKLRDKRPTGEWIEFCKISSSEFFRNKENFIESKCSNCNRWSLRLDFQIEDEFCPFCGAKMKGGDGK